MLGNASGPGFRSRTSPRFCYVPNSQGRKEVKGNRPTGETSDEDAGLGGKTRGLFTERNDQLQTTAKGHVQTKVGFSKGEEPHTAVTKI